jgi:transcriptional antiterminator RfaH
VWSHNVTYSVNGTRRVRCGFGRSLETFAHESDSRLPAFGHDLSLLPAFVSQCWYLLRTKANAEQQSYDHLERQGYAAYFPRFIRRIRRVDTRSVAVVPLFPGYVFVHVRIGEQILGPIKSTRGVLNIVRFGEDYAVVPDRVIHELHLRANDRGLHEGADRYPKPHDRIRVKEGPFEGMEAIFQRDCGEDRVLVLMSILGHDRTVKLPEHSIELSA